jgi:hypothetical protein
MARFHAEQAEQQNAKVAGLEEAPPVTAEFVIVWVTRTVPVVA